MQARTEQYLTKHGLGLLEKIGIDMKLEAAITSFHEAVIGDGDELGSMRRLVTMSRTPDAKVINKFLKSVAPLQAHINCVQVMRVYGVERGTRT